jgi:hypothetical protein
MRAALIHSSNHCQGEPRFASRTIGKTLSASVIAVIAGAGGSSGVRSWTIRERAGATVRVPEISKKYD